MSLDYSLSVDAVPAAPWTPKVGDRVRCVPSPECQEDWGGTTRGHPMWALDVAGTIIPHDHKFCVDSNASHARHPYRVALDEPMDEDRGTTWALYMSITELEPLHDEVQPRAPPPQPTTRTARWCSGGRTPWSC